MTHGMEDLHLYDQKVRKILLTYQSKNTYNDTYDASSLKPPEGKVSFMCVNELNTQTGLPANNYLPLSSGTIHKGTLLQFVSH